MSQRAQEATVAENLEPLKPKDLGINDVEFYEVESSRNRLLTGIGKAKLSSES